MRKIILLSVFVLAFVVNVHSKSSVSSDIKLISPDSVAKITLDKTTFFVWVRKVYAALGQYLANEKGDKEVVTIITLHRNKNATIHISARPAISIARLKGLRKIIAQYASPKTKLVDYTFAFVSKVNKGCSNKKIAFSPLILTPSRERLIVYKKMDMVMKKKALQNWVSKEVLPVLTHLMLEVDPKFKGVLAMGKILKNKRYEKVRVRQLADHNIKYWRAVMEMNRGNPLVPFAHVCMLVMRNEFSKASKLLFSLQFSMDDNALPAYYCDELMDKIELLHKDFRYAVSKGTSLHDKGQYKQAIKIYQSLLKGFPRSPTLHYEIFYSKSASLKTIKEKVAAWEKARKIIYDCDPMYHVNFRATTGYEGYLMLRRKQILALFKNRKQYQKDFVQYADIALDLKNYGLAAYMYWVIYSNFKAELYGGRDMLAYFLYCMEKLGHKRVLKFFKKDYSAAFKKIAAERKRIMETSAVFKAFKKGY